MGSGSSERNPYRDLLGPDFLVHLEGFPEKPESRPSGTYPRENEVDGYQIWSVEEKALPPEGVKARFTFTTGRVSLDWDVREAESILRWSAYVPSDLLPGKDGVGFHSRFLHLLFQKLPQNMDAVLPSDVKDRTKKLAAASSVELKAVGEPAKTYKIARSEELTQLAIDFNKMTKPERLTALITSNVNKPSLYSLGVEYPRDERTIGEMTLALPSGKNGGAWKQFLMGWVLESHMRGEELEEREVAAVGIANILRELSSKR